MNKITVDLRLMRLLGIREAILVQHLFNVMKRTGDVTLIGQRDVEISGHQLQKDLNVMNTHRMMRRLTENGIIEVTKKDKRGPKGHPRSYRFTDIFFKKLWLYGYVQ